MLLMAYSLPPLAYLHCFAARWRISLWMDEGAPFTSLIPCDISSFSIISFSPHLNLKATSQPFLLSTLFIRWQKTISPVPEVRNSKSGKLNYSQTSYCSVTVQVPTGWPAPTQWPCFLMLFLKNTFQISQS